MTPPPIQLISPDPRAVYSPLLPDETVSSWARRHGVHIIPCSDEAEEGDYGRLRLQLPRGLPALLAQLRGAAQAPDAWLLRPHQRTLKCARCLAEDWARGVPAYDRRAWDVAWRTCCFAHGPLEDTDQGPVPPWNKVLGRPVWTARAAGFVTPRPYRVRLVIPLYGDRRARHLEEALALGSRAAAWFPRGLDENALREAYQKIIRQLLDQFHFENDESADEFPSPTFNRQHNHVRFALNVLTEAILSQWTKTPLPPCVSAQRTALIFRAIGWGRRDPEHVGPRQVLFQGEHAQPKSHVLRRHLLPREDPGALVAPDTHRGPCYFTLSEARQLGLHIQWRLRWLAELTRKGQFAALDTKGGHLTPNRFLPEALRLDYEAASEHGLRLPMWAYARQKPVLSAVDADRAAALKLLVQIAQGRGYQKRHRRSAIRFAWSTTYQNALPP